MFVSSSSASFASISDANASIAPFQDVLHTGSTAAEDHCKTTTAWSTMPAPKSTNEDSWDWAKEEELPHPNEIRIAKIRRRANKDPEQKHDPKRRLQQMQQLGKILSDSVGKRPIEVVKVDVKRP